MSELHVDVSRTVDALELVRKSAPAVSWCMSCKQTPCELCAMASWIEEAVSVIDHAAAILRSYGRKVIE